MTEIEPHPYGDEFNSVEELIEVIKKRQEQNLQLYGHAVIYIANGSEYPQRVGARVANNGDVMAGAHCEWI